jgi:hypothetical protein
MPRFLIALAAALLAHATTVWAQPTCAFNSPACNQQGVNPQPTDIVLGQQAVGPSRNNQVVKFSLSQLVAGSVGTSTPGQLLFNLGNSVSGVTIGSGLTLSGSTLTAIGGGGGSPGGSTFSVQYNQSGTAFGGVLLGASQLLVGQNGVAPIALSASGLFDSVFSNAQGALLYRGATGWQALAPGSAGQLLATGGASANPGWSSVSGTPGGTTFTAQYNAGGGVFGGVVLGANQLLVGQVASAPVALGVSGLFDGVFSSTQGSLLYRASTGTGWQALPPGVAGQVLMSGGVGANPAWSSVSGAPGGTTFAAQYNAGAGAFGGVALSANQLLVGQTSAAPIALSQSGLFDAVFGSAQGSVLYRAAGGTGWQALGPGTAGQVLATGGAGANPSWTSVTGAPAGATFAAQYNAGAGAFGGLALTTNQLLIGQTGGAPVAITQSGLFDTVFSSTQGSVLYRAAGGTGWQALGPGTAGQALTTGGAGANPSWASVPSLSVSNSWTAGQAVTPSALTDGATITPNFATSNNFTVTIAGNRTIANPSNVKAGECGFIAVTQDATGSRTLAWGANWKFNGGVPPVLTTTGGKTDLLTYCAASTTSIPVQFAIGNF